MAVKGNLSIDYVRSPLSRRHALSNSSAASMVPGSIALPVGLLIFGKIDEGVPRVRIKHSFLGWSVQARTFWLVPDIVSWLARSVSLVLNSSQGIALIGYDDTIDIPDLY